MNEENAAKAQPDEEPTAPHPVTPPAKKPADGWAMPEPVFRQSSGRLPEGFEKRFTEAPTAQPEDPASPPVAADDAPAPVPDIPEQPVVAEVVFDEDLSDKPPPPKKQKSKALRTFLIIVGIAAMILGAIGLLAAVYLYFFIRASESQNLN